MTAHKIQIDQIQGDDKETQVLAHACDDKGSSLTFRVSYNAAVPLSIASRIVVCFHELTVASSEESFEEREGMRAALRDVTRQAWPSCVHAARSPDAVVDIGCDVNGQVEWHIRYESALYQNYLHALSPANTVLMNSAAADHYTFVNYTDLAIVDRLAGRGTSAIVRQTLTDNPQSLHVLKSLEFGDFLASQDAFMCDRDAFYHAINVVFSLPPHPNIQPPPRIIAIIGNQDDKGQGRLCGTLYPVMTQGSLDDQVTRCKKDGVRITLQDKALWCLQLSSALAHTHHTGHAYHMDVKPANVLIDDQRNAVLIDWEQSGAPQCTIAPEAVGDWDVEELYQRGTSELVYRRYRGPPRVNNFNGWPSWNVFPEWSRRWPRACEAAEVFSLGRTMWMLLQQVPQGDVQYLDRQSIIVGWSDEANDIPDIWKAVVMGCLERDPNKRIGLGDLVRFWEWQRAYLMNEHE